MSEIDSVPMHVLVDRLNIKDRENILKIHARGVKRSKDVDISVLAASLLEKETIEGGEIRKILRLPDKKGKA